MASWGESFWNGVESPSLRHAQLSGFPIHYEKPNKRTALFEVILNDWEKIVIKTYKALVNVKIVGGDEDTFGHSVGLMGNFVTGERLARDGVTVLQDANQFGQEWQVLDTEPVLFQSSRAPQYPQKCTMPQVNTNLRGMSRETAERACAHHDDKDTKKNCIFDVMVTGDLGLAQQL